MSARLIRWNEVTGVFGGTFDPPHLGHREAVRGLFENPGLKRVLVIPSGTPPLKPGATSTEHRLRMTELAFVNLPDVRIDPRELERTQRTSSPSFTIDTLSELKGETQPLAFILGTDQLPQLHTWHRFPDLLSVSHWIVLARRPDGEAPAMKTLAHWESSGLVRREGSEWVTPSDTRLKVVSTEAPAVSSSEIRARIGRATDLGQLKTDLDGSLLPSVRAYLMEHRIYGMRGPS